MITGDSKELLEEQVKPRVEAFLKERGLELSVEKTKITHIDDGFNFLGFNLRKYNGKLLIKPAKASVKSFLAEIRATIKANQVAKTENQIRLLNAKIRGWANYFSHVVAKAAFGYVDYHIYLALAQWIRRRHLNKSAAWRHKKYYRSQGQRSWVFFAKIKDDKGNFKHLDLFRADSVRIKRHVKIRGKAHPFDPEFTEYFKQRKEKAKLLDSAKSLKKA